MSRRSSSQLKPKKVENTKLYKNVNLNKANNLIEYQKQVARYESKLKEYP